jgi:serine/threonine protein kinase
MAERANLERELFNAALERTTPEHRAAFLDGACGSDAALRARVEALLRAAEDGDEFLAEATVPPDTPAAKVQPGTRIDRYKLLERIGEGGFGVVYMAEQEEPVRRRVALKIVKPGMDTRAVAARFEAERQALAMMDHPNIAKVLDGGETASGRPYFVMELVRGVSPRASVSNFSSASATRSSTRTRRASSTATSSRRTSLSPSTTTGRCRR